MDVLSFLLFLPTSFLCGLVPFVAGIAAAIAIHDMFLSTNSQPPKKVGKTSIDGRGTNNIVDRMMDIASSLDATSLVRMLVPVAEEEKSRVISSDEGEDKEDIQEIIRMVGSKKEV